MEGLVPGLSVAKGEGTSSYSGAGSRAQGFIHTKQVLGPSAGFYLGV